MKFQKMHGTGNDFIIINGIETKLRDYSELAKRVCDRHFGIGADGIIIVEKSEAADIRMCFYNADGTEAPMCGNGIRCFSRFVYDKEILTTNSFTVETLAGIMKPEVIAENGRVEAVRVNMGKPVLSTKEIPVAVNDEEYIDKEIEVFGNTFRISTLIVGNTHTVVFADDLYKLDIEKIGPEIENNKIFPGKTNVNFCKIVDKQNIEVITWERGVGVTLSCGTGAAACYVICKMLHKTDNKINVYVKGGKLVLEQINEDIFMTGPAELICEGEYYL